MKQVAINFLRDKHRMRSFAEFVPKIEIIEDIYWACVLVKLRK